jgi:nucleotide-binding universal stress UspA family protein
VYSKILVALDGSYLAEQILPFVRWIAEPNKISVQLLTISDPDARAPFWPAEVDKTYLKEVAEKYFTTPKLVTGTVERGEPATVIVDCAKNDPSCLIAMATHGVSGVRRWLLGSVASKVIQAAVNPLLLIRPVEDFAPSTQAGLGSLIVPLDGSSLAEKVLPHVASLARQLKLRVRLIQVYTLPKSAFVVADGMFDQGPAVFRDALRKEAETYLAAKVEQLRAEGIEQVSTSAIEGDAASEIIDSARAAPDNLIAMSTHGRSGVTRWVLGSVAERVIQHSGDPVLIIRRA